MDGSHTHWWCKRIRREISVTEVPLRSKGSKLQMRYPNPGFQCQKEKCPTFLAVKKEIEAEGDGELLQSQTFLLKGPQLDFLQLISFELWSWDSNFKGTRDIWGGNDLSSIRAGAGKAAFFQTEC